jgi:RNA polymerase sigma-70 factor (ECF subfamily)
VKDERESPSRVNPTPDDRQLVSAYLRDREENAFRALYRRHSSLLYGSILRLARGDAEEAQELLQLTWIRAAENLHRFRWESSLRSWLTGIAINCHRDALRRRKRRRTDPIESVTIEALPSLPRSHREIGRLDLERAIAQLPDGYREVLLLHDVEGYTHDEIGEMMGIRNGTSKSQLSRARRAVRSWLGEPREKRR